MAKKSNVTVRKTELSVYYHSRSYRKRKKRILQDVFCIRQRNIFIMQKQVFNSVRTLQNESRTPKGLKKGQALRNLKTNDLKN